MDRMTELVKRIADTKITVENSTVEGVLDKCPECNKTFTRYHGQQVYCSDTARG